MIKTIAISLVAAFAMFFAVTAYAQTATPTPTATAMPTVTPTGSVQGASTTPSGAPNTGFGY